MQVKMFDLMHAPDLLGGKISQTLKFVKMSILIGFGYDLSDTQDELS